MSLGGDGTFLKTASLVLNNTLPVLGVNTHPTRSVGHLCSKKIQFDNRQNDVETMMKYLNRENFEFVYRQRLLFEMTSQITGKVSTALSLNEVFVAEKNVGNVSVFRTKVDGNYLGRFKSSGLIISTGTGSTGWLYSAMRYTEDEVNMSLKMLGFNEPYECVKALCADLSKNIKFSQDMDALYYYIREPILQEGFEHHWQGFGKHVEYSSELIDGRVNIDGLTNVDIGLGDSFTV